MIEVELPRLFERATRADTTSQQVLRSRLRMTRVAFILRRHASPRHGAASPCPPSPIAGECMLGFRVAATERQRRRAWLRASRRHMRHAPVMKGAPRAAFSPARPFCQRFLRPLVQKIALSVNYRHPMFASRRYEDACLAAHTSRPIRTSPCAC